ncbi:hypothetical protein BH20ACI4_BH20ACI4_17640 [soil metagenome]
MIDIFYYFGSSRFLLLSTESVGKSTTAIHETLLLVLYHFSRFFAGNKKSFIIEKVIMYQKTFYATHPESIYGATNNDLRGLYLVNEIFAAGEVRLNYSHFDRIAVGGAMPTGEKISLPVHDEPESAKGKSFLDRREMGAVNIGEGKGKITVDGTTYELGKKDCLYIAKESADVSFESDDAANPAKFYLLSTLAHKRFETKLLTAKDANKLQLSRKSKI